jgi:hypothetical protein
MDMDKWFKKGFLSVIHDAIPRSVLDLVGTMGLRGTPREPWFVYQNIGDRVSNMQTVENLIDKHCRNGATIKVCTEDWRPV